MNVRILVRTRVNVCACVWRVCPSCESGAGPARVRLLSSYAAAVPSHSRATQCASCAARRPPARLQKLFETGVDEMSWDDMDVLQVVPAPPQARPREPAPNAPRKRARHGVHGMGWDRAA